MTNNVSWKRSQTKFTIEKTIQKVNLTKNHFICNTFFPFDWLFIAYIRQGGVSSRPYSVYCPLSEEKGKYCKKNSKASQFWTNLKYSSRVTNVTVRKIELYIFANLIEFWQRRRGSCAVWPDLAKFRQLWKSLQVFLMFFIIWQNAEHILANLWHYWANFHCCKYWNFEKII